MAEHNSWYNDFDIEGPPTGGGNAKVYFVKEKTTGKKYALKELRYSVNKNGKKKYRNEEVKHRFLNEINIVDENASTIQGIIPIITSCKNEYWYTMPIANTIMNYIPNKSIDEIVLGVIQLSETLSFLHDKEISHRDIKPANIYFHNDRFAFGDFGLVDFPDNFENLTRSDRGLGAIFTIAPEMKRNPKQSDGKKADVFSLAKTMWMLLSGNARGFDGVYNYLDPSHSLRYLDKYKNTHLVEIDELLKDSTDNNPDMRPTIKEFKERLTNWLDIYKDIDKSQSSDWNFLSKQLFGSAPPESSAWKDVDKIVEVLNIVGMTPAYNHMFFSDNGGLDFSRAELANEEGCIQLYDTIGFCHIVKPKKLYYEGFNENYKWDYFLLELNKLNPIFNCNNSDYEYLVEDKPSHYVSAQYVQYGVYDYDTGDPLPEGYKTVCRYTKGKFLFVMKTGPYNRIEGTYDGRHGDCSANEFREYMELLINTYTKIYNLIKEDNDFNQLSDTEIEYKILGLDAFQKNPFKKDAFNNSINEINEIKHKFANQQKSKNYIKGNYSNWKFKTVLQPCSSSSSNIKFVFIFTPPGTHFSLETFTGIDNYICTDGYIRKLSSPLEKDCYSVYNRELAISLKDELEQSISEILSKNNLTKLEEDETCISIDLFKSGNPTHLFTKQEIEEEMRNADDRIRNQLVIDENGYAKVIKNDGYGYLFPVRHESWDAGNVYVGKYSKLSTLDDNYISSLQGWLSYLETGRNEYMDYLQENKNEENLLKEIKKYY